MKQPFEQFYPVWSAEKLLDWAYSKARKKSTGISSTMPKLMRIKTKEINRITRAAEYLSQRIERIIKSVPNIDELPIFYRKLSNILVDNDELKRNLGRLNGVLPVLTKLVAKYKKIIKEQQTPKQCSEKRVEFFGRCSSLIRELDDAFKFLEESRQKLLQIPPVNLEMPGVVVAGYPNVGKSTLVGKISTAKPVISSYPFTTKQIFIGMYRDDMGSEYFQVIDTPGILDRPMSKRNNIEKQAILALNTIASVILFVFDPTPTCRYDIDSQIDLYNEIKNVFLEGMTIPVKIIINKVDLATDDEIKYILNKLNTREEYTILINAKDGKNIDKVIDYLLTYFKETNFSR